MDYHVAIGGEQQGPLPEAEVHEMIAAGRLSADDLCWTDGWTDWKTLGEAFPQAFAGSGPPPMPSTSRQTATPQPAQPSAQKTSGFAIASLVLGLAAFLFSVLTALPAIICGHLARSEIRKSAGKIQGAGIALAGLIIGYAFIGLFAVTIAAFTIIPAMVAVDHVRESTQHTVSESNLHQIVQAQLVFANDNNGRLADDFAELGNILGSSLEDLMDLPYTDEVETDGYVLVPGLTTSMPPDTIVTRESKPRRDGTVAVGYLGGNVVVVPELVSELGPPPED